MGSSVHHFAEAVQTSNVCRSSFNLFNSVPVCCTRGMLSCLVHVCLAEWPCCLHALICLWLLQSRWSCACVLAKHTEVGHIQRMSVVPSCGRHLTQGFQWYDISKPGTKIDAPTTFTVGGLLACLISSVMRWCDVQVWPAWLAGRSVAKYWSCPFACCGCVNEACRLDMALGRFVYKPTCCSGELCWVALLNFERQGFVVEGQETSEHAWHPSPSRHRVCFTLGALPGVHDIMMPDPAQQWRDACSMLCDCSGVCRQDTCILRRTCEWL
ncbi:hypothetical protein COO60DRAFT_666666 [Scenedesmus sp. NREL 46B-D3]|nr:hypothetical protein COO60DRAFT_666666 [Scenedesmus sp. NREL 46B-D3]